MIEKIERKPATTRSNAPRRADERVVDMDPPGVSPPPAPRTLPVGRGDFEDFAPGQRDALKGADQPRTCQSSSDGTGARAAAGAAAGAIRPTRRVSRRRLVRRDRRASATRAA